MNEPKITDRGWAGHFICADRCRFRRNTLIDFGKKKIVVSTVGVMPNPLGEGFTTIGLNRHYETMAFRAKKDGAYWDADVTKEVSFESNWRVEKISDDSDNKANEMHDAVVKELAMLKSRTEPKGE